MKNVTFLFLFIPMLFMGQISVNQGKIQKIKKGAWAGASNDIEKLIGADESGVYVMRHEKNFKSSYLHIEKYNKSTFELIYTTNLDIEKQGNIEYIKYGIVLSEKKVHFLFKASSAKKEHSFVLYDKVVNEDGSLGEAKELEEFPYQGAVHDKYGDVNFTVKASPDGYSALVVWDNEWKDKNSEGRKILASLYKLKDLSRAWSKEIPNKFNSTSILMPEFAADNNGNLAYFFGYSKGDLMQAAIGFISMTVTAPKFAEIKVEPVQGIMAVLMRYKANKLTGAFTTYNAKSSGICYFSADVSKGEVFASDCKAFTSDLANNLNYVSGQYYPGEKGYEATGMEEIGGNYYYTIEHSSKNEQSLGGGTLYKGGYGGKRVDMGGATNFSDYIKRNIVVAKINTASNKIEWMQVIPKFVVNSVGGRTDIKMDDINGTYFIPADKKLFLFYLENPDVEKSITQGKKINLDKLDYVSESSKKANVVCYEIDENKNVKRSIVYTNAEIDARPLSKGDNVILEKGKSVLVYFLRGKSESLGSFTIK